MAAAYGMPLPFVTANAHFAIGAWSMRSGSTSEKRWWSSRT